MRRSSATRSRLLNGRRSLRSSDLSDAACSRAASRRSSRLESFDFAARPPRLESRADSRSSRLAARRSLADSFRPLSFLLLSTRATLRREHRHGVSWQELRIGMGERGARKV